VLTLLLCDARSNVSHVCSTCYASAFSDNSPRSLSCQWDGQVL
jgi:hypothetical protein